MIQHKITGLKLFSDGEPRLLLAFDEENPHEMTSLVDLSLMLRQGGVFSPLKDPKVFASVKIGPRQRTLEWHIGDDVVDLCADALWFMADHNWQA
jgi:Protein of unknown function (DUF2442)